MIGRSAGVCSDLDENWCGVLEKVSPQTCQEQGVGGYDNAKHSACQPEAGLCDLASERVGDDWIGKEA